MYRDVYLDASFEDVKAKINQQARFFDLTLYGEKYDTAIWIIGNCLLICQKELSNKTCLQLEPDDLPVSEKAMAFWDYLGAIWVVMGLTQNASLFGMVEEQEPPSTADESDILARLHAKANLFFDNVAWLHGLPEKAGAGATPRVKITKKNRQTEVRNLYRLGYTAEQMEEKLDFSVSTIKRDWKELGLRERKPK